jgi:hypothetical protein
LRKGNTVEVVIQKKKPSTPYFGLRRSGDRSPILGIPRALVDSRPQG